MWISIDSIEFDSLVLSSTPTPHLHPHQLLPPPIPHPPATLPSPLTYPLPSPTLSPTHPTHTAIPNRGG